MRYSAWARARFQAGSCGSMACVVELPLTMLAIR